MVSVRRVFWTVTAVMALLLTTGTGAASAAYSEQPRDSWQVLDGRVYAIAVQGDRVYIGGTFTALRNPRTGQRVQRTRLAAFERSTGDLVTGFAPSAADDVRALAVSGDGSRVFLGGAFLSVNGVARTRLAAVDRDGDLVDGWTPSANAGIRDMAISGDALFVAGVFGTVSGAHKRGFVRISASTGAVDGGWTANTSDGRGNAVALSAGGSLLYLGGTFGAVNGQPRSYLAAVSTVDGDVTSWSPPPACSSCRVLDLSVGGGAVYGATGGSGGHAAGWDDSASRRLWTVSADGDCQAVAYHEGVVYVGGHFGPRFGAATRHQLAAVSAGSGDVLGFDPGFTGLEHPGTWALVADSDFLRVGGGFRGIVSGPERRYAEFPYV